MKSIRFKLTNIHLALPHVLFLGLFIFPLSTTAQTITYYSDVPLYSSLVQCASIGCSVALSSIQNCGSTSPVSAYASCACLKNQNSASISGYLTAVIQEACGSTATEDASSVLAVFHSWCQAVAPSREAKLTATAATATSTAAIPGSGVTQPSIISASASSSSTANPAPSDSNSSGPSSGQWAAISVGVAVGGIIFASLVALCAGWMRPEQILWVLTCSAKGSRHRKPRHERLKRAGATREDVQGAEMGPLNRDGGNMGRGGWGGDGDGAPHPGRMQGSGLPVQVQGWRYGSS